MKTIRFEAAGFKCLEVSPSGAENRALPLVIFMHGRGDWGESYVDIPPAISATDYRYVFPTASLPIPGALFEWFRLDGEDNLKPGAATAGKAVSQLLDELQQRYQTPPEQIVLGGFSQGGMMTLEVGLQYPQKLAGLFLLSSFLIADADYDWQGPAEPEKYYGQDSSLEDLITTAHERGQGPIFLAHGSHDAVIPIEAGKATRDILRENGLEVDYYEFEGGHELQLAELQELSTFLAKVLLTPADKV